MDKVVCYLVSNQAVPTIILPLTYQIFTSRFLPAPTNTVETGDRILSADLLEVILHTS